MADSAAFVDTAAEFAASPATSAQVRAVGTLFEYYVPPHCAGVPLHWHKGYSESFYILSGIVTLQMARHCC